MNFPNSVKHIISQTEPSQPDVPAPQAGGWADPRPVIRGETIRDTPLSDTESLNSTFTFIDYLSFTYRSAEPITDRFPLQDIILNLFRIPLESIKYNKGGRNGYDHCITFEGFGCLCYGGFSQKQTVYIQLSGQGCRLIEDWLAVYSWGISNNTKITRLDIAYDDYSGIQVNIKKAIAWYEEGLFSSNGRPPKRHLHDDFDNGDGKTFYVGKRQNSRYLRVYEKGKKEGNPDSLWCRAEVEFKSKDLRIEWEAVLNSDQYLSGAYKAFEFLSIEQCRFERISRDENIALSRAIEWLRTAGGQTINLLLLLNDNDPARVIELIRRTGIPKKLEPLYQAHLARKGLLHDSN